MQTIELALLCAMFTAMVMVAFPNKVKKYRVLVYLGMILVESYFVGTAYFGYTAVVTQRTFTAFFCMGVMAEALFAIVAYVGVLPRSWELTRRLKSVRAELSVLGCIISFGEIFYYSEYLLKLFDGSLSVGREIACIATVMLLILMIPLMLSSLYFVRRHMSAKNWKRLQCFSYLFYFGLLLHIVGLYGNFNGGDFLAGKHAIALKAYLWIWVPYFTLRISKYIYCWKYKVKADPDMIIQDDDQENGPAYIDVVKTR